MEILINEVHTNKTNTLQKCSKCQKFMPKNQFINEKGCDVKYCNLCRQQSSIYYKKSLENNEKETLPPKEMAKKLYNDIMIIGCDENLENESAGINFECDITLDNIKEAEDSPHEISRKIADLIGNSDGYYYIYLNNYHSKKTADAFIYLKHKTLHQQPERNRVTDKIKNKIKENLQLAPSDIYSMIEQDFPEISQKQIHAWWTVFIQKEFIRDDDQVNSAKMFLEEHNLQVIMFNNSNGVKLLGVQRQDIYPFIYLPGQQTSTQPSVGTTLSLNAFKDITATTNNNSDQLFKNYESMLQDALSIVQEQHEIKNVKWAKSVEKSFKGINKLVTDIKAYKRKIKNPRTWKDHNRHTMFL
ncbi:3778_t:CDS:2 [Racocetra fulgida]|uniref:3778_t:CDS:1 n=1 Tax=Racocetra fulgida TaxID=60492 RepID=A0A9N8WRQ2_9GLOM|nr:3778_t:CDS:2 [Racocetra fulgida]